MMVTVPLRDVGGAFLWFLVIGAGAAIVGTLIQQWQLVLFIVATIGVLAAFGALLAYGLSRGFDAYYERRPGTVEHRLHKMKQAAYVYELAVQDELGTPRREAERAARKTAKEAVEADRKRIAEEQAQARAEYEDDKQRRAAEAAAEAARRRAVAEERVAGGF